MSKIVEGALWNYKPPRRVKIQIRKGTHDDYLYISISKRLFHFHAGLRHRYTYWFKSPHKRLQIGISKTDFHLTLMFKRSLIF